MKKLSCGLLALSMAFNGAPALLGSNDITTIGAVEVSAATEADVTFTISGVKTTDGIDLIYIGDDSGSATASVKTDDTVTVATGAGAGKYAVLYKKDKAGDGTVIGSVTIADSTDSATAGTDLDIAKSYQIVKFDDNSADTSFTPDEGDTVLCEIDGGKYNLTLPTGHLKTGYTSAGFTLSGGTLAGATDNIALTTTAGAIETVTAVWEENKAISVAGSITDNSGDLTLTEYDGKTVTLTSSDAKTEDDLTGVIAFLGDGNYTISEVSLSAGTYTVTITDLDSDSYNVSTFTIAAGDLDSDVSTVTGKNLTISGRTVITGGTYTTTAIEYGTAAANVAVTITGTGSDTTTSIDLTSGDYTVTSIDWGDPANTPWTGTLNISGTGDYKGTATVTFTVTKGTIASIEDKTYKTYSTDPDTIYGELPETITQSDSKFTVSWDKTYDTDTALSVGDDIEFTGTVTANEYYDLTSSSVTATVTVQATPEEEYVAPEVDDEAEDDADETVTDAEIDIDDIEVEDTIEEVVEATPLKELLASSQSLFTRIEALITLNVTGSGSGKITVPITGLKSGEKVQVFISSDGGSIWSPLSSSYFSTKGAMATMINGIISNTVTSSGSTMNLEINVPSSSTGTTMIQIASVEPVSSGSTSPGSGSYTSATYHDSGSVRVNGSYITELRNVLVGELVNLSKITTVNGQEVTGWYYDSAMTREITNPSQFVITSSVIGDGIYARTSGTTVVPDSYVDGSTNAGTGATTAPETTYQPSVVPSTVANLLGKLF